MIASDILDRCSMQLNDVSRVRWTEKMLLNYLTDAMRQTVLNRPDANAKVVSVRLEEGKSRQRIPSDMVMLLKVVKNMGWDGDTPGRPITHTTREALDTCYGMMPDYESDEILQFYFVQATPEYFHVYPLPGAQTYVEIECAGSVPQVASLSEELPLNDVWAEPVREYVMYLAYSLNGASQVDNARANAHLQQYYLAIGNEKAARVLGDPYNRSSDVMAQ